MLIEVPLDKWDTAKVDYCLDQGKNIYNHADDLCATEKRIIKNVLIRKHFFDIIVKKIQILNYSQNKDMDTGKVYQNWFFKLYYILSCRYRYVVRKKVLVFHHPDGRML